MWRRGPRRRHPAGADRTDPDTLMVSLGETVETLRISLSQEEEEQKETREITEEKHTGAAEEEESEANRTMGG